ncbi:response regulator transcription factor [Thiomicrospira aerophila]|uniref:response regulator transcription factor n=1 Tax=Thiomicrospira aerophila TaxID=92245 RepID=UPI00022C43FF|nr:response regulator transcription factor [Thiomicrospira aerophila]
MKTDTLLPTASQMLVMLNRFEHPEWTKIGITKTSLNLEEFEQQSHLTLPKMAWICTDHPEWQAWLRGLNQHKVPCAVMSFKKSFAEFQEAIGLGAKAYTDATANATILQQIEQTLAAGSMWLPAELLSRLVGASDKLLKRNAATATDSKNTASFDLTAREHDVAEQVCQGLTNKKIATQLNITERTVKQHMSNLLAKTGAKDRMQLMLIYRGYK